MAGRRARGARPARPRSRHFLRSGTLADELVRGAGVRPDELVLDLGAGGGRLTAPLARSARRVLAVELDPELAARLRGRWRNVDVVCGDARAVPLPREPFRVVANLPFDGTNAILRHLLDDPRTPLVRADVIVEWGVAVKRALPWPSTLNGVLWGAWYRFTLARRLPASAFAPPPSVDAAVLVVERRATPFVPDELALRYRAFVARGFRHGAAARLLDAHEWAARFSAAGGGAGAGRGGTPAGRRRRSSRSSRAAP